MNSKAVLEIFCKATEENRECNIQIWIGPDGVFHQDEDCSDGEEISVCSLAYYTSDDHWIVTPWLYNSDCPIVLKKAENARQMAYFWLNWMEYLYGDEDGYGRRFEEDWLKVKSNRSLLMRRCGFARNTAWAVSARGITELYPVNEIDPEVSDEF